MFWRTKYARTLVKYDRSGRAAGILRTLVRCGCGVGLVETAPVLERKMVIEVLVIGQGNASSRASRKGQVEYRCWKIRITETNF